MRVGVDRVRFIPEFADGHVDGVVEAHDDRPVPFGEPRPQAVGLVKGGVHGSGETDEIGLLVEIDELTDGEDVGVRRNPVSEPQSLLRRRGAHQHPAPGNCEAALPGTRLQPTMES